jgi:hypothetical protein
MDSDVSMLALVLAAVDSDSTAYGVGRIIGTLVLVAAIVLAIRLISRRRRQQPVRLKAVLLAIGGVLLTLTVLGELLFVAGLTK